MEREVVVCLLDKLDWVAFLYLKILLVSSLLSCLFLVERWLILPSPPFYSRKNLILTFLYYIIFFSFSNEKISILMNKDFL